MRPAAMSIVALGALGVFVALRISPEDHDTTLRQAHAAAVDEARVTGRSESGAGAVADAGSGVSPTGGVIEGVVTYEADRKHRWRQARYYVKKEGRLAEAIVALRGVEVDPSGGNASPRTWTIDQKNFQFTPETLAIRARDSVRFTNSDREVHNVRTLDGRRPFNISLTSGSEYVHRFPRAGGVEKPVRLGCAFHGTMRAWIYVFGHAFFHVTSGDGAFRFEGVPSGEYWLDMVHPAGGLRWSRRVKIESGGASKVEISVSPDDSITEKRDLRTNGEGAR